ncbi:MAG: hypothetical protein M0C28_02985 [Candidatus Moduliflexus flocculans]|nr:hypothetical protein [Candidatus Moduliflexus flocculans]
MTSGRVPHGGHGDNITARVEIHDLWDTFATQALQGGIDIRTVAEYIGDDPAAALKRYCHTDERVMRLAADRMPDLVFRDHQKWTPPAAEAAKHF